jgi:hypothetical protein
MPRIRRLLPFFTFALILCAVTAAHAQFNASIQGTVLDPTGAVIPNASVVATNHATGVAYKTNSSQEGFYRISGLPPGHYTVAVEASGFKKQVLENIAVVAESPRGVDVKMETGSASESITVTSEPPPLQTENSAMSGSIDTQQVQDLPKFGSDPYELVRLAPGVFGTGARAGNGDSVALPNSVGPGGSNSSIYQTENLVQISANGQRASANSYSIDGVSVNSQTWGGAAVITPNQESVKELQVVTGTYSAEESRTSGAQVKVISQSGTNKFHGSAFFRYQNPTLNAYNKWGGPDGGDPVRNDNKYRQFGGSLGGPIIKNKLFFFFSMDGNRANNLGYSNNWVDTPEFDQLLASARPDGLSTQIVNSTGMTPRTVQVLTPTCTNFDNAGWPCQIVGNAIDIGSPTGALGQYVPVYSTNNRTGGGLDGIPDLQFVRVAVPSTNRAYQYNARADYNLGQNQFAVGGYITMQDNLGADSSTGARPSGDVRFKPKNQDLMASWIRPFSSTWLNEFRFNATRWAYNTVQSSSTVDWGIPRVEIEDMPIDRVRWGAPQGETTPASFAENTFEFRDVMTKVVGRHAFKFGGEIIREQDNNNLLGGARPVYTFATPWNLFNDTPLFEAINTDPVTGGPGSAQRYFRTSDYGIFFQDDWKLRPNLTLNLGIRYEYYTPLRETQNRISNLVLGQNGLADAHVAVSDQLFNPDRNNFAPRLGFAWSPAAFNQKTVLRGGIGVSYDRIPNALWANTRGNPPFLARWGLCCATAPGEWGSDNALIAYNLGTSNSPDSYPVNPALTIPFGSDGLPTNGGAVEFYGAHPNVPNAYVYTYSLDIQQELPAKFIATLGYAGAESRKLIRIVNQNFVLPQAELNPAVSRAFFPTPDVNANYNALNLRVERRFANGLQFVSNYRWAKSMDTLSNEGPGFVTNQTFPQNQAYEYGPSDYDVKHYFNLAWIYELPIFRTRNDFLGSMLGGWTVSGLFSANTGFPWTPLSNSCNALPNQVTLCPVRPIAYAGGAPANSSNHNYMTEGANFPGGGLAWFTPPPSGPLPVPGIGRNSFRGPGYKNIDLSIAKDFKLGWTKLPETSNLELKMNMYNAFNILNLVPLQFGSAQTYIQDPHFGTSASATAGRTLELQARFSF